MREKALLDKRDRDRRILTDDNFSIVSLLTPFYFRRLSELSQNIVPRYSDSADGPFAELEVESVDCHLPASLFNADEIEITAAVRMIGRDAASNHPDIQPPPPSTSCLSVDRPRLLPAPKAIVHFSLLSVAI